MGKFLEALRDELIVYVRHSAWLDTAPKHPEEAKGKKHKSRRVTLEKKHGVPLAMPECGAAHLLVYLFEVGPALGDAPLTHGELQAWMDNTGIELTAWEARVVKRLSLEYLSERQRATAPESPCPWPEAPYVQKADPSVMAQRLQRHLERLGK